MRDAFGGGPFLFVGLPRPVSPLSLRLPHLSRFPYRLTVRIPGFHPGARDSIPREGAAEKSSPSHCFCFVLRFAGAHMRLARFEPFHHPLFVFRQSCLEWVLAF